MESGSTAVASLGRDSRTLPLWFKPEKFVDPEFSPEAYVTDLRRYVPLDELGAELTCHLDALRARLVEVVNADYDEFVSLSTKLVDVDGAVADLQRPLLEVKSQVEAARSTVGAQAAALQQGLARRQAAAAARALLELAQDAVHVMAKVETLLGELPAAGAQGGEDSPPQELTDAAQEELEGRSRLLDRLCSEVSRLNFYAAKGGELAIVRQMAPRMEDAAARLQVALDSALRAVLRAQNPAALSVLLHAYSSLGRPEAAELVVEAEVVRPVVAAAVQASQQQHQQLQPQQASSGAAGEGLSGAHPVAATPLPLPQLLPAIAAALKQEVGAFLELAMASTSGPQGFDFLSHSVLPEVVSTIEAAAPTAFSPGLPDNFHANYLAATHFLGQLEGFCTATAQVAALRASPACQAYLRKWNLAAYFSLRFQDVAGRLEEQLATAGLTPAHAQAAAAAAAAASGPAFAYAATAASWAALQRCVDQRVFLPPLADRFLRLALQLVARYACWVQAGLAAPAEAAQPQEEQQQGGEETANGEAASVGDGTTLEEGAGWAASASVEQLAALAQDASALQEALQHDFLPRLAAALGPAGTVEEVGEALAAAFGDADTALAAACEAVLHVASAGLVDRCCEALKQLRGIVATFRMTNRALPTRPSHYVATILAPLQAFLSAEAGDRLSEGARAGLVRAVVEGVAGRYRQLADDTLSTVRKTESSLRRLKSRKGAGEGDGEGGGGGQDTDKMISMQLFLDVQEFGRRVGAAGAGLQPAQLEGYRALWRAVAPEDKADQVVL